MTADVDYMKLKRLVNKFVKLDKSNSRVRSALFYVYVESELEYEKLEEGYKESKVMREMRKRYQRGKGAINEPSRMYDYFNRKFSKDIQKERARIAGNPYQRWQKW